MPTLKEYFATAKLTPQDRGATAWEQAGRRISAYAEQTAQGDRQLGKDIADLWNEAKFGPDVLRAENEPGRGGGVRTGNVHDALDFGRPFGADRGANGPDSDESSPGPSAGGYYNSRAARQIGAAAATLPTLIQRLMDGQGLTDEQYQQLSNSSGGRQALFNNRNQGGVTGVYDDQKGAVKPNPEPTDEEVAKAGFTVDKPDFGQMVPTYPLQPSQWNPASGNLRDWYNRVTQPVDDQSDATAPMTSADMTTDVSGVGTGVPSSNNPGAAIYNAIQNTYAPAIQPALAPTNQPQATDQSADTEQNDMFGGPDNPSQ